MDVIESRVTLSMRELEILLSMMADVDDLPTGCASFEPGKSRVIALDGNAMVVIESVQLRGRGKPFLLSRASLERALDLLDEHADGLVGFELDNRHGVKCTALSLAGDEVGKMRLPIARPTMPYPHIDHLLKMPDVESRDFSSVFIDTHLFKRLALIQDAAEGDRDIRFQIGETALSPILCEAVSIDDNTIFRAVLMPCKR